MSPWLFNVDMDGVMKEVKMGMGRRGGEITGGWERVEIAWPLRGGPKGDGGTVC